jgi:hypothetical protein
MSSDPRLQFIVFIAMLKLNALQTVSTVAVGFDYPYRHIQSRSTPDTHTSLDPIAAEGLRGASMPSCASVMYLPTQHAYVLFILHASLTVMLAGQYAAHATVKCKLQIAIFGSHEVFTTSSKLCCHYANVPSSMYVTPPFLATGAMMVRACGLS